MRRMRCPAIEGIETGRVIALTVRQPWAVECVAPLLRGLKHGIPHGVLMGTRTGRMRCPAIEGIETRDPRRSRCA